MLVEKVKRYLTNKSKINIKNKTENESKRNQGE